MGRLTTLRILEAALDVRHRLRGLLGASRTPLVLLGSGESGAPPQGATVPQRRRRHGNAGVIAVARAMGLDLGNLHGYQYIGRQRWLVDESEDAYRPLWIHHSVTCREGAGRIHAFGSADARLWMSVEAMPETIAAALPGRSIREVTGIEVEGHDLVVSQVETSGTHAILHFGYQPYVPLD